MPSFLSHLECTSCNSIYSADELHTVCPNCGKVLFARYDLEAVRRNLTREHLLRRDATLWRWRELLPVREEANIVTLGEGGTPLLYARNLGRAYGFEKLYIKAEGLNPTGSFKARGMAVAVSRAQELGVRKIVTPSAGNAAGALAAYGAAAGMETYVFMPHDAPDINKLESAIVGAHVYLVNGLISDAGRIVKTLAPARNWFDVSTLQEPYRAEGKKTMGLELAEQFNWELPDAIIYPTGGGTGIVGMWKAFAELEQIGWIDHKRPKMISVQASGCAPLVKAFEQGKQRAEAWQDAQTIADGLRVPHPFADYLILDTLRASGGTAVAVSDDEIRDAMREWARLEGMFVSPESAATFAAFKQLAASGFLQPHERVVLFDTGTGIKYSHLVRAEFPVIDPNGRAWEEQVK
ncbi:MAG: threonine synthase [Chloroflexi bacterium]|nr:threonine synthase [Chloroflexota bacterium]